MDKRKEFNMYIDELEKVYQSNPDLAIKEAHDSLLRLGLYNDNSSNTKYRYSNNSLGSVFGDINIDILITVLLAIFGICLGFINFMNPDYSAMWFVGYIFFIAGHFIGMYVPVFGLIFLFSHSITGLSIMNASILEPILKNPIMQDNPKNIFLYISIVIGIYIIATLLVILHNLSNKLKKRNHMMFIPLGIYTIGFILISILPHIFNQLYNFHLFGI